MTSYLKSAAAEFEAYAKKNYVESIKDEKAQPESVLAGLRFIATRKLTDQYATVQELLSVPVRGALRNDVEMAGLDALLATSADRLRTGRYLVALAVASTSTQVSALGAHGLKTMGRDGRDALLEELCCAAPVAKPKKLARLLMNLSKAQPPVPIGFWDSATPQQREEAVQQWRTQLQTTGEL